jgi:MFS family permease
MATALVHGVALAQDLGIAPQSAASVVSLIFVTGLVGRVAIGKLSDRLGGLRSWLLASAVQTVMVFWFTRMHTLAGLYVVAVVFGLGYSGVMTSFTVSVRELVPLHVRSTALGVVYCFGWLGMGVGAWQAGWFFDHTGSYTVSFANAAGAGIVNLILVGSLWLYVSRRRPEPALDLAAESAQA